MLGDIGRLDADGYLYLGDRLADMILRGGANIYPAEIEAAVTEHPDVRSCVVVGLPDPEFGQRVHAILELDGSTDAQAVADGMAAFLADRLSRYKHPESFEVTSIGLRDDSGKVRRTLLRDERAGWLKEDRAVPDRAVARTGEGRLRGQLPASARFYNRTSCGRMHGMTIGRTIRGLQCHSAPTTRITKPGSPRSATWSSRTSTTSTSG